MGAYRKPSQPAERAPKRRVVVTLADAPDEPLRRWKRETAIATSKESAASATRERITAARVRFALEILAMIFDTLTIW